MPGPGPDPHRTSRRPGPACLLAVLASFGCGGKDAGRVAVYPVEGRVFVAGRPAGNARLAFHPLGGGGPAAVYPVGVTLADGTFRLTTYTAGDGAPAGEYVVTMTWPHPLMPVDECECVDPATHDRLQSLYADPATSQLRATVRPGPNAITIQATVGGRGWNLPPLGAAETNRPGADRRPVR